MDSPETEADQNGTAEGNFGNSNYPLLSVENGLPTDGLGGKKGLFKVNGTGTTQDDEGKNSVCFDLVLFDSGIRFFSTIIPRIWSKI